MKLLASVIDHQYSKLVLFTAYTGLPAGEVAALRWRHVDLDALSIVVDSSLSVIGVGEKRRR